MLSDSSKKEIEQGAQNFVECMLMTTMRLVQVESEDSYEPVRPASGFLFMRDEKCYLITAGHVFDSGKWVLETRETKDHKCLQIKIPSPTRLLSLETDGCEDPKLLDIAWAEIDSFEIADSDQERSFTDSSVLPIYLGPLEEEPTFNEAYGFASWSRTEYHKAIDKLIREAAYEVGMEYDGMKTLSLSGESYYDQEVHRFSLNDEHQGHSYYEGASGSPIANAEGKIVSVLIGGSEENDVLYGFPIQKICSLIGIQ